MLSFGGSLTSTSFLISPCVGFALAAELPPPKSDILGVEVRVLVGGRGLWKLREKLELCKCASRELNLDITKSSYYLRHQRVLPCEICT